MTKALTARDVKEMLRPKPHWKGPTRVVARWHVTYIWIDDGVAAVEVRAYASHKRAKEARKYWGRWYATEEVTGPHYHRMPVGPVDVAVIAEGPGSLGI